MTTTIERVAPGMRCLNEVLSRCRHPADGAKCSMAGRLICWPCYVEAYMRFHSDRKVLRDRCFCRRLVAPGSEYCQWHMPDVHAQMRDARDDNRALEMDAGRR